MAYAFAPASVVAPLGTVALVSNAIIAPFALKEKFRPQDLAGIVFAIGGAILVVCFPSKIPFFFPFSSLFPSLSNPIGSQVIFSASTAEVYTVEQLVEALGETKFIVYVCLTFVGLVALLFLSPRYGKKFLAIDMLIVGIFGQFFSSHFFFCLISLI